MRNELVRPSTPHLPLCLRESYNEIDAATVCGLHLHDEIELLSCVEGLKRIWVDETEYDLHPGEVCFIHSRVPHRTQDEPPVSHMILLQFRPGFFQTRDSSDRPLRYLARFIQRTEGSRIHIFPAGHEIFSILSSLAREEQKREESYETFLRGGIYYLLGTLYRAGVLRDTDREIDPREVDKILPALTYLHDAYGEDITLSDLSARCGMSDGYFCRRFRAATGSTPMEYLNFVRIYNAEKLLTGTDRSILDISMEVGYANISYFNRMFRRFKGCAPNNYRHAKFDTSGQ